MADTSFREAGHFTPRVGRANGSRVVLVTEPSVLGSLGEGLAIHGYETSGYSSEPGSRAYLGQLATHVIETKPDAVVALVHPDIQDIFLQGLDGVLPLVILETVHRGDVETSPTTQVHRELLLPSEIARSVHEVIEAGRQAQE